MSIKTNTKTNRFHEIHGKNIELKCGRTKAIRKSDIVEENVLNNIVFTQFPIMMLQPTVFKITQTNTHSHFCLMVGFTHNDPYNIQEDGTDLSEYTVSGKWTRMLLKANVNRRVLIISFYVKQFGTALYSIDDEKDRFLFSGIDISQKLWAFIELSSCVHDIEWVGMAPCLDTEISPLKTDESRKASFHWIHGQDICLTKNKSTACRSHDPGYYAYVFTNRPFEFSDKVVFTIDKLRRSSKGILEYGITSNDPSEIFPKDLPENTGDLLNFPNYWVIYKEKHNYNIGDVIIFIITKDGKFMVLKNFSLRTCILQIEVSQPLWLFIKLSGSVSEISIRKWSNREYCDVMTKKNQFIVSSGSDLCSYGSAHMVSSKKTTECLICCEKPNDCAVYRCGHLCMCYECAVSAWRREDIVSCPVCRADIQDIIKIYS